MKSFNNIYCIILLLINLNISTNPALALVFRDGNKKIDDEKFPPSPHFDFTNLKFSNNDSNNDLSTRRNLLF